VRKLASFFGGILIFLLGAAICTVLSIFVIGAFCVSYPITRLSPRDARLKAIMDLLLALMTAVQVLRPHEVEEIVNGVVDEGATPNDT